MSFGQTDMDSLRNYSYHIINVIKANSYYSNDVNWDSIKYKLDSKLADSSTNKESLMPFFKYVLEELGDFHGSIDYNGRSYGMTPENPEVNTGLSIAFKLGPQVRTEILDSTIGYIYIPLIYTQDQKTRDSIALAIQKEICLIMDQDAKNWIVDLRVNLGGDMYAMLGGLTPFLKNDILGKFIDHSGKEINWSFQDGNIYEGSEQRTYLDKPICNGKNINLAILISPITCSSGEVTAISLKSLPNATLIGERTSGYTTATQRITIDQNTSLILAGALVCDKNGLYQKYIIPDFEVIGGDNLKDLSMDLKIIKAKQTFEN